MKGRYPGKLGGMDDEDFVELQKALFKIGAITNDLSLIPIITSNSKKKEEIQAIIGKCEPLEMKKFVGREPDVEKVVKMLTNKGRLCVSGINLFGESGVGKTTLAQEIAKSLKDFQLITIDLRGILEMGNVYFHVLEGFKLPAWDKDISRFNSYLKTLKEKTLLILDNVEQLHGLPSQKETESQKAEFFDFLLEIVTSTACKSGYLKLLLTSRERLDDAKLRQKLLCDHNVKPFDDKVSKRFLSRDEKQIPGISKEDEEADMQEIVKLCKNIPYLLQGAKQMLREDFSPSSQVLERLKSQLEKRVPKEYACLAEQFESIPNDHLKQLAVKISLLQQPFSISTAMKIGDISSNYDAGIDLELLAVHKVISKVISKVDGKKLKYDIHAQFKDFVNKYLCKAQPQYKDTYQEGEKQFFIHFSGKMSKLAQHLDNEFVNAYSKLEGNRANFELAIDISKKRSEVFDVLLHSDEHNEAALMGLLFETLKDINERKKLYEQWAENAEKSGKWLVSAQLRCWQALQGADMEGTRDANEALHIAKESFKKAEQQPQQWQEKLDSAKSLFFHASGRTKWLHASKLQDSKEKKEEIQEGIRNLKEALRLSEDATKGQDSMIRARIINLIGNCYMELNDPSTAETYFLRALEMTRKLVGSDNHWEIPTYYNQIAQVHERRGMDMEKSFFAFWHKKKINAEYKSAVEWMEKALKLQEDLGVGDTEHTATFQRNLANSLIGIGDYGKALLYANKCYENRLKRLGEHPETVRILYLTGIINEWRKDIESARKSYEQAFEMEEALPEYNHSIVRTLIRERLEAMYKKLKLKDKIAELKDRIEEIEEREKEAQNIPDTCKEVYITVNQEEGTYKHLSRGFCLQFPPDCVTEATRIKCEASSSETTLPSPAHPMECLVSSIVQLGPCSVQLKKPFVMILLHCGVEKSKGYETKVKVFNEESRAWKEMEELPLESIPRVNIPPSLKYVGIQLSKMAAVAVVSRLVTDTFEVPVSGCVVKSSVCDGVTLRFPEGAVDRPIKGSLRVIPIPDHVKANSEAIPTPILLFSGFGNVIFSKPVRITVPRDSRETNSELSKAHLLRLDAVQNPSPCWEDIATDNLNVSISERAIELDVYQFCGLWIWNAISVVKNLVDIAYSLYPDMRDPPSHVSFGAYQKKGSSNSSKVFLKLTCVANNEKQLKLTDDLIKQDYCHLENATSNEAMRKNDKAFPDLEKINLSKREEFFLEYLGSEGGPCEKTIMVKKDLDMIDLNFYRDKETKGKLLCNLPFEIKRDDHEPSQKTSNDRKIWVEYCGITFDILREISEQDANLLRQLFEEQKVKDTIDGFMKRWYDGDGVEEFLSLIHKIPYHKVYEAWNRPDQNTQDRMGHILNKIQYGHKITAETFLLNIPQELTNTISKMSTESIKDYNKFGQLLGLSEEVLKSLGSSHAVLSFWKENNKKTGKVADLLKALRECWAVDPAKQLAKTITEIARIGQTGDNAVSQVAESGSIREVTVTEPQAAECEENSTVTVTKSQAAERESNREVTVTETQAAECEENSRVTVTKSQAAERKSNRDVAINENRAAEHEDNSEVSKKQYSGHWKDDPDSSDVYRMKSNPRGLMVIINMQKFAVDPTLKNREELMKELTEREGSERDVDKLTDLFSGKLNFKVCTIIDKPRIELLLEVRSFADDSAYKDYDCLAVCIMSHGKDDKFYAYDGKQIKVSAVYNMFSNSMCEVFRFKPKLFFIQACRGPRGSKFVAVDGPSVESSAQHPPTESKDADMADMLIAYSSFEDYTSYRHSEEGSYFIQSLVRFFREYADSEHVEEILTRVKNEVHRLIQETSRGRTQIPAPVSTLRKKLYFWPGMDFNK